MRLFLDTNVLVSAMATRGLCADVLREVLFTHRLVVAAPLLSELERILKDKIGIPKDIIDEVIEFLRRDTHNVPSAPLLDIDIQDEGDIVILSYALEGNADLFVTGDRELLNLGKVHFMEIVSPREFWEKLKSIT
ncbi:MAG: putative toxin-antitoxin system toxin component, PIN family [Candidatus Latescibacteria bacterium]|jgi:uncharacterized protein|nr:putative toxin-antitoxin system toxin component, PIN family [Candidatus Latescibacterota bacterium]